MMEREDIIALGERTIAEFIAAAPGSSQAHRFVIRMTSGTTGDAPIVILNEHDDTDPRSCEGMRAPAVCIGSLHMRLANVLLMRERSAESVRVLIVDDRDLDEAFGGVISDFRPDCFRGFSSFVMRVGSYLDTPSARGVKLLKFSGEKLTPLLQSMCATRFPNAEIETFYIAAEIGPIAERSCSGLPPNHYHASKGVVIEIASADGTAEGDLLISRPVYRSHRVERYRVGDIGRVHEGLCACGRPVFEFLGRRGSEYLKLAGALLVREEFDRVALRCEDLFDDYRAQAEARSDGGSLKGRIFLRVYRQDGMDDTQKHEIAERFSRELFLTPTRTLEELVRSGDFLPLTVEVSDTPFQRKHKDIKLTLRS